MRPQIRVTSFLLIVPTPPFKRVLYECLKVAQSKTLAKVSYGR